MTRAPKSLQRACFVLQVRADRLTEFLVAHQDVWPEYLRAFQVAGFERYTSWVTPDGLFVGYFEAENPVEALARLASTDVDARWQLTMQPYFTERPGATTSGLELLTEAFDLADSLARLN